MTRNQTKQQQKQQQHHNQKSATSSGRSAPSRTDHNNNNQKGQGVGSGGGGGGGGLVVRINQKSLNDDSFHEVLESRMKKVQNTRQFTNHIIIQAQNNHLTDASISTLAKYITNYLQLMSRTKNSSSSSSKDSRSKKGKSRDTSSSDHSDTLISSKVKFELNFSGNELQGRTFGDLIEVLDRLSSVRIKSLNLSWNPLSDMTKIGRFIQYMNRKNPPPKKSKNKGEPPKKKNCIKVLSLAKNGIDSENLATLCTSFDSLSCISSLLLYQNNIIGKQYFGFTFIHNDDDGLFQLHNHLLKTNCTLTELNLAENQLGSFGVKLIAAALKKNTSLKILNLRDNKIELPGIRTICEVLFENNTLQSLDLSSNNYFVQHSAERRSQSSIWSSHDEGLFAISQVLQRNTSLTSLSISQQNITQEALDQFDNYAYNDKAWGYMFLFEALKANRTLKYLDLRGNYRINLKSIKHLEKVLSRSNSTLQSVLLPELPESLQIHARNIQNMLKNRVLSVEARESSRTGKGSTFVLSKFARMDRETMKQKLMPTVPRSADRSDSPADEYEKYGSLGILDCLPVDILRALCDFLHPSDIAIMETVCHTLTSFLRSSDYIWNTQIEHYPNLRASLPLIVHTGTKVATYRSCFQSMWSMRHSTIQNLSEYTAEKIPSVHRFSDNAGGRSRGLFRVDDFKFISLSKTNRQNIKPIALYSDQYGILAVLFNQDRIPAAIHEVDYLLPTQMTVSQTSTRGVDMTVSFQNIKRNSKDYVQVTAHNGDQHFICHVTKNKWDRAWVRYIASFRLKRHKGRHFMAWLP